MLLVEGLTANLTSISQLCDQRLNVIFSRTGCIITSKDQEVFIKGSMSKDNLYMWISQPSCFMISNVGETNLYHQRLGHLNLKGAKKAIYAEAIGGLPNLKIEEGKIYGECQIGKVTKISHKKL